MENLEKFDAKRAREFYQDLDKPKLNLVLYSIVRKCRERGRRILYVDFSLDEETLEELKKRGFKVKNMPPLAIQKEGLYHSVSW